MGRDGVPVIDMEKGEGLGEELVKACEEWGCFRVVNHGVPAELMAEMKLVAASLFDLPRDIKRRTANHHEHGKGYIGCNPVTPFLEGLSIDEISSPKEFFDLLEVSPHQREIINNYIKFIRDLAELLGRKLLEGTGLAGDLFEGWYCQLRMNKYHYGPESVGLKGVDIHTDPSFLTILQDDENINGLQVVDKYTGEFVPLDPVPGTLAVNIGDIGKVWSNGRYCNVKHRVWCFEPKTRYSIALFVLGPNEEIEAPSELVDLEHPRLYVPIDVVKYRQVRHSTRLSIGDDALKLFKTTAT
ncbi:2-oxoglutarate-dependent dioxygenase DAO-like [Rutidosis leptorrhynchoides]|uniref:2-oxoglutarate-dependent dioxygenase DAO-like n=1 Tax=Rutidosis leptorrhynchoides TaxID=125765 RepID=UPI003A994BA2